MNFKTTLLTFLSFSLAIFIYFKLEPKKQVDVFTFQTIGERYHLRHNLVRRIEVTSQELGFESYNLARTEKPDIVGQENWAVSSPINSLIHPANTNTVNQLLTDLLGKKIKRELETVDLFECQLEPPRIQVKIWTGSLQPIVFFVGKKTVDYSIYVKVEQETAVFLVESSLMLDLKKTPAQFRLVNGEFKAVQEARLLDFQRTNCYQVEIHRDQQKIVCQKKADGWKIIQPRQVSISQKIMDDLLFGIDSINIEEELKLPLEKTIFQINFLVKNEMSVILKIGQNKGDLVDVSHGQSAHTYLISNHFLQPVKAILKKSGNSTLLNLMELKSNQKIRGSE